MIDLPTPQTFDPAETYALSESGVMRGSDGAHIPEDEANADWRAFREWQASGKTASPYQPPPSAPQPETVSWMDFVGLFAPAELMAIATSTDPSVAVFRLMATGLGGDLVLGDPRVAAGLDALVAAGLIEPDRKAQVLAREKPAA
ncbi:MAG: hypothetical protein KF904_00145 [Rhodoblastus sp.]|nr:hypothetical protein [Rhodoblastus sp.]